jgi:hypothetical protein
MTEVYDGRQVVGMDLHRRRSVLVRMTEDGRKAGDRPDHQLPGGAAARNRQGREAPAGGAGGHVRLVLGRGRARGGGGGGAPGAPAAVQGHRLGQAEERPVDRTNGGS